jgi:hypothetical protein
VALPSQPDSFGVSLLTNATGYPFQDTWPATIIDLQRSLAWAHDTKGRARPFEAAVAQAHMQIPPTEGRDFTVSKVVEWGMQYGGFIPTQLFYAIVEDDLNAPFRTEADAGA